MPNRNDDPPKVEYDPELQCGWNAWTVTSATSLRLDIPWSECVDMAGCIAIAQRLMPGVTLIRTYAGDRPDTSYSLSSGKWLAITSGTSV